MSVCGMVAQTGPVTAVVRGVTNEVVKTVNDQLHSTLEAPKAMVGMLSPLTFALAFLAAYFSNQSADAHARRQAPVPVPVAAKRTRAEPEGIELKEKVREKIE